MSTLEPAAREAPVTPAVASGLPAGDSGVGARQRLGLVRCCGAALLGLGSGTAVAEPVAALPRAAAPDKLGDIQAVYAWMSPDVDTVNLVMTVSPFDDGTAQFGPGFQYVFHLAPHRALNSAPEQLPPTTPGGEPRSSELDIICQFPGPNEIECWVGRSLYVRGNPTTTDGLKTTELRIFAGRRSDPFFFNELGFERAANLLRTHAQPGSQQCSAISPLEAAEIQAELRTGPDRFSDTNVLALVINIKKNQLNITNRTPFLSVWGSTHRR